MTDTVENLILDLVEWVGRKERAYEEAMEAWRTSCPKLPVWERPTEGIWNDHHVQDTDVLARRLHGAEALVLEAAASEPEWIAPLEDGPLAFLEDVLDDTDHGR